MKPLLEGLQDLKFSSIVNEATKQKQWHVSGITMRAELKNGNGRIYPTPILSGAVNEHITAMPRGRCVGELKHPSDGNMNINPDRISHKFIDVQENGNDYFTKAKITSKTTCGKQVISLLEEDIELGMSSRAVGNLNHKADAIYVTKLHIISLGDIVHNPSCPGAFLDGIFEGQEWVWSNGIVIGKDLSENIDNYKKIIEDASPRDKEMAMRKAWAMYFKDILG